ncbi:hypothetical protein [Pseudonocardia sp. WMMC193]|uniref:hypothetical protein n=1 Tax=Pseudonocardia sp. WMMC193 TaxID=2911965 RepID=UPI001F29D072|nr:hypothetical protein [Pseudonocardia sp. WMMC193]MCF7547318.1 hypothetical protein [Pseudonocardia sp. WMMC193]
MALVHELTRGELGRWFAARMRGTAQVAGEVSAAAAAAAAQAPVVRPPRGQSLGARHWAEVGGVFGMRMAAAVEQSPPYYGLYGLVAAGLLTPQAAHRIAAAYPSHHGLPPRWAARALDLRPTPSGWLEQAQAWPEPDGEGWADRPAAELAERTHRYHDQHAPTGTIAGIGAERGLARSYGWWSTAEDIYRSGIISVDLDDLDDLLGQDPPTADLLRGLAPPAVVEETARLSERLRTSGSLGALHEFAGRPARDGRMGYAGPVFVPHWADGDLLVGDTLVDVKTVLRVEHASKIGPWLWQVLAYAWLDSRADHYRIRAVALYLSRHGLLLRWPVDELAAQLLADPKTGGTGVAAVREEFLALAAATATRDGATVPLSAIVL